MKKKIMLFVFLILSACTATSGLEPESFPFDSKAFPAHLIEHVNLSGEVLLENWQLAYCQISRQGNDSDVFRSRWQIAISSLSSESVHYVINPIPQAVTSDLGCDGYPLGDSTGSVSGLDWSPNGHRLLFSIASDVIGISKISADGSTDSSTLFLSPPKYTFYRNAHAPIWSPDGSHVAFISTFREGPLEIGEKLFAPSLFVANLDGTHPRYFVQEDRLPGVTSNPSWSNDGTKIAYVLPVPQNGIGIVDIQSGEITQLDSESVEEFSKGTIDTDGILPPDSIAWLPGDNLILMVTNSEEATHDILWVIEPDGKNPLKLVQGNIQQIQLSPTGLSVAVIVTEGLGEFAIYNISFAEQLEITNILKIDDWENLGGKNSFVRDLDWSHDGRYLGFAANPNGDFDLFAWDSQKMRIMPLTNTPEFDEIAPRWRPYIDAMDKSSP